MIQKTVKSGTAVDIINSNLERRMADLRTDRASVNMGTKGGVGALLKQDVVHIHC